MKACTRGGQRREKREGRGGRGEEEMDRNRSQDIDGYIEMKKVRQKQRERQIDRQTDRRRLINRETNGQINI